MPKKKRRRVQDALCTKREKGENRVSLPTQEEGCLKKGLFLFFGGRRQSQFGTKKEEEDGEGGITFVFFVKYSKTPLKGGGREELPYYKISCSILFLFLLHFNLRSSVSPPLRWLSESCGMTMALPPPPSPEM